MTQVRDIPPPLQECPTPAAARREPVGPAGLEVGDAAVWWKRPSALLVACVVATLLLRMLHLRADLTLDEGGDLIVGRSMFDTTGSIYGRYWLDRPPLLPLLFHLVGSGGAAGLRLLATAAACMLVPLVWLLARTASGTRAAMWATPIATVYFSTVGIGSTIADGGLFAAVPAAASVLAMLVALRTPARSRSMLLVLAGGVLAAAALLLKQSFGDAFVAGLAMLAVAWLHRGRPGSSFRLGWVPAFVIGFAVPLIGCALWASSTSAGLDEFVYAMLGFRADALAVLQRQSPFGVAGRLSGLLPGLIQSGLGLIIIVALRGVRQLRHIGDAGVVIAAWLAAGAFGVLGGGYYEAHYYIQLVAVFSVLVGIAMAGRRGWGARTLIITGCSVAVVTTVVFGAFALAAPTNPRMERVARFMRERTHPGDTVYVVYSKPNLTEQAGLEAPFRYQWSSMMRAIPTAEGDLRAWLRSPQRPTWVVEWNRPTQWHLDQSGATRRALADHYVEVARVCGVHVLRRTDRSAGSANPSASAAIPEITDECSSSLPSIVTPQQVLLRRILPR